MDEYTRILERAANDTADVRDDIPEECAECPLYMRHLEHNTGNGRFFCEYCYVVPWHPRYPAKMCRC